MKMKLLSPVKSISIVVDDFLMSEDKILERIIDLTFQGTIGIRGRGMSSELLHEHGRSCSFFYRKKVLRDKSKKQETRNEQQEVGSIIVLRAGERPAQGEGSWVIQIYKGKQ